VRNKGAGVPTKLGTVGPAQSEHLYHFTSRNGRSPHWVPPEIREMDGPDRLNYVLRGALVRTFPPFGVGETGMPCLCLSESTPEHLAHLLAIGRFGPWAIVTNRTAVHSAGGGTVAYVPTEVFDTFKARNLGHWAVRTDEGSTWMHEREWRIPVRHGWVDLDVLDAILVGDADWRPSKMVTEWMDIDTGLPVEMGPPMIPHAVAVREEYPRLWRETPVWVWDQASQQVVKYKPGELC
jgi:hypothetical protein